MLSVFTVTVGGANVESLHATVSPEVDKSKLWMRSLHGTQPRRHLAGLQEAARETDQ